MFNISNENRTFAIKKPFWGAMMSKNVIYLLSISVIFMGLQAWSFFPNLVENQYSLGLFPLISSFQRWVFGSFGISWGDILYGLIPAWFLLRWVARKRRGYPAWTSSAPRYRSLVMVLNLTLTFFVLFSVLWGMNYHRQGVAHQLSFPKKRYRQQDLEDLNRQLVSMVNDSRSRFRLDTLDLSDDVLFAGAIRAYRRAAETYPFLEYRRPSLKSSYWGWAGNYLGFTGYYNPFTGEAQVNTSIPYVTRPFTACHEIAHQLGYASEGEANFVGFLAAISSDEAWFRYSACLDMFLYANRNLYAVDSVSSMHYRQLLRPQVKKDLQECREFSLRHQSFLEPVFMTIFDLLLKSNRQRQGVWSYDAVVQLVLGYFDQEKNLAPHGSRY